MKRILTIIMLLIVGYPNLIAQSRSTDNTAQEVETSEAKDNKESRPHFCPNLESTLLVAHPDSDSYSIAVGINYYPRQILEGPYAGIRIGWFNYLSDIHISENGTNVKAERSIQGLTFPVEIGYAFSKKELGNAIIPFAAIDTNITLKSKIKREDGVKINAHLGGIWTFHARVGVKFRIRFVNIGMYCAIPINENFKDLVIKKPFPGITFGLGF